MMLKTTMLKARTSVLPAIVAVLALSSTPLLAQQVPTTSTPTDPVAQTPPVTTPPVTDAAPAAPDTSTTTSTTTDASPVSRPAKTTTARARTVTRTTRTAVAKPAPAPSRPARTTRTTVTQTATATAPATPATPAPAPAPNPNSDSAVAPVVDLSASPANKPAQASKPSNATNEMLEIGGGALALIALGGIAYSVVRRRRREDEWHGEWAEEPVADHDHVIDEEPALATAAAPVAAEPRHDPVVHEEQPAIVGPSAFTWGQRPETAESTERDSDDDRLPGESWVERAHRGPSANNPSVSLKNRLRRAAFFDKRERDVAAGIAEPVDPDAGLPEAMADQDDRELA